jgi:hypothetical protein
MQRRVMSEQWMGPPAKLDGMWSEWAWEMQHMPSVDTLRGSRKNLVSPQATSMPLSN